MGLRCHWCQTRTMLLVLCIKTKMFGFQTLLATSKVAASAREQAMFKSLNPENLRQCNNRRRRKAASVKNVNCQRHPLPPASLKSPRGVIKSSTRYGSSFRTTCVHSNRPLVFLCPNLTLFVIPANLPAIARPASGLYRIPDVIQLASPYRSTTHQMSMVVQMKSR